MSRISLDRLLASRDRRSSRQRELLAEYPGCCLICLTVQLPGSVKRSAESLIVGGAGMEALLTKFGSSLKHAQVRDLESGYEAYLMLPLPPALVKRLCCEIEDTHPLGRLMDIDVLTPDGPLDRGRLGFAARRCLLCDHQVQYCMRAGTHSQEELWARIEQMVSHYCTFPMK